jgi:hypothetical protein
MSKIARPQRVPLDIGVERDDGKNAVDCDTDSIWPEPPVPADPRDQRSVRNRLIVLDMAGPVARLESLLLR